MSSGEWQWVSSFVLGAVFVALYCAARFEGPAADRSYTTFCRYAIATGYYAVGYLGIYYVIVATSSWALRALVPEADGLFGYVLGTPAWVALIIVVLLSRFPWLSRFDQMFRQHARYIGGIPTEALRLRDAIHAAKFEIPPDSSTEIHYSLLRRGLDLGNMHSVPDHTLHALFLHAAALKHFLEQSVREPRFARFFNENARPLHDLTRRFDHLLFKSSRGIDAIGGLSDLVNRTSGKSDNWDSLGSLVETAVYADKPSVLDPAISTSRMLVNNLRDDMRFFIEDTAMFLARLTLYHRWTERGRVELLKHIGVPVEAVAQPRYWLLFVVFGVVFVVMFFGMTAFGTAGDRTAREIALLLLMVPTLFVVALLCAIYPKQYFAFANVNVFGRPPYLFFAYAGIAAAVLAFTIGLAFRTLIYQDGEEALRRALESSPWLLISITVAVVVSMLVQDARTFENAARRQRRRWSDAAILAVALGVAAVVVQLLLPYTRSIADFQPRTWPILFSALIGGFIGYFVPCQFRTVCKQDPCPLPTFTAAESSASSLYSNAS